MTNQTSEPSRPPWHRRLLPTRESRAFFAWSASTYLVVTAILLAASLRTTGGRMIYVLDDPAIHQSIATNLAEHGTWGVEPGHFQSASSSPLWTMVLAVVVRILPAGEDAAALALNVVAALAILAFFARVQRSLLPSWRRPLDVLATAVVTVAVLFLPGATFVGMEHLAHLALVLAAVHGLLHPPGPGAGRARRLLPYVLLGLASLARMESAFVALALGTALVATCLPRADGGAVPRWADQLRRVVLIGVASGAPLAAFALFNRAMGQGWLPNSVLAKSAALDGQQSGFDLVEILNRLTSDAILGFLAVVCVLLVVVGWPQRRRWLVPSATAAGTILLHVVLADVGWFERYQVYLIGLATYAVAMAARDLLPAASTGRRLAPLLLLPVLLLSAVKVDLTVNVPRGVDDTFEQRYQAARFLQRYYDGRPVATGELGYISLLHEGPVTDLFGLGDYEVLEARRRLDGRPGKDYWLDLGRRRGFPVAAVYPSTLFFDTPDEWILVGTWSLPRKAITAYEETFQFWATSPEEVAPLQAHLREFATELPAGVTFALNPLADVRARQLQEQAGS